MWLRQEVQQGHLHVEWKPTTQMPADGLTKSLVRQRHQEFVRQLGLNDVSKQLVGTLSDNNEGPEPTEIRGWY